MSPEEDSGVGEVFGAQVLWAAAEGAGCVQPGEKEAQGWPYHSQQPQGRKRGCSLFSQVTSNKMKVYDHKLKKGSFKFDIRKTFHTETVTGHWNTLCRELFESASLEIFVQPMDVALEDTV